MSEPVAPGPRFVVVGRYLADCVARSAQLPTWGRTRPARSVRMAPGGKALNQAVALARQGARVTAVGAVGDDPLGRDILATLEGEGVATGGIDVRPGAATPICVCIVGDEGQTAFLWNAVEDVVPTPATVDRAAGALAEADATLVTFEAPAGAIARAIALARAGGGRVVVHPGPTNQEIDHAALPWGDVDVLVPNEVEARALLAGRDAVGAGAAGADLARHVARRTGVPIVVVTLGEDGCAVEGPGVRTRVPAIAGAAVADTMGASDAFTAVLAYHLTIGTALVESVHEAQRAAAWTIARPGGHEAMPHR